MKYTDLLGTKSVGAMNEAQLAQEKKRRISQLAQFHTRLGREVEVKQEGIGVEINGNMTYFLVGDDPQMVTIHRIMPVDGDLDKLLDVAASATNAAFAAKIGIGPNGENQAAHFTMEMFMPNLKAFFQVIDVYLSALDYARIIFDDVRSSVGNLN